MPTSDTENKEKVVEWYRAIRPTTVIDVGPGDGTYARLLRGVHRARWTAIEAWGPYVAKYDLAGLYDHVIVADARYVADEFFVSDLVIFGDVLEHMDKVGAENLLRRTSKLAANVVASVPVVHATQEPFEGNTFEIHRDHWRYEELIDAARQMGTLRDAVCGHVLAYAWWSRRTTFA